MHQRSTDFPLVTLVIPVYNVEQYLNHCISSVIHQTYKELEIILVDDCSTDGSGILCDHWEAMDSRIHSIHRAKNGGLSEARNTGLGFASGEYITFLDSDDWVSSTLVEHTLINMKKTQADIGIFDYEIVNEQGIKRDSNHSYNRKSDQLITGSSEDAFFLANTRMVGYYMWNKLYRINLLKDFRFKTIPTGEDAIANTVLFEKMTKFVYSPYPEYYYRTRQSSLSHRPTFTSPLVFLSPMLQIVKEKYPYGNTYAIMFCMRLLAWYYSELIRADSSEIKSKEMHITEDYIRKNICKILRVINWGLGGVTFQLAIRLLAIGYFPHNYCRLYRLVKLIQH